MSALTFVENGNDRQETHHLKWLISVDNLTKFLDGDKPAFASNQGSESPSQENDRFFNSLVADNSGWWRVIAGWLQIILAQLQLILAQ